MLSEVKFKEYFVNVPDDSGRYARGSDIYTTAMTLFGKISVIRNVWCNCSYVGNWEEKQYEFEEIKGTFE